MRVGERIAHAGLRGEMDDALRPLLPEQLIDRGTVGEIGLYEAEAVAPLQLEEARFLQFGVVIVVQIIEADHLMAEIKQPFRRKEADKARSAGYQDFHDAIRTQLKEGVQSSGAERSPIDVLSDQYYTRNYVSYPSW